MLRRAQLAAHVHAGGDVGEFLLRAQVDARVVHRPVVEDQAPALDVQLAAIAPRTCPDSDVEFALAAADLANRRCVTVMPPPSLR